MAWFDAKFENIYLEYFVILTLLKRFSYSHREVLRSGKKIDLALISEGKTRTNKNEAKRKSLINAVTLRNFLGRKPLCSPKTVLYKPSRSSQLNERPDCLTYAIIFVQRDKNAAQSNAPNGFLTVYNQKFVKRCRVLFRLQR